MDNLTILTVNFNTPDYIYALVKSLHKYASWYKKPLIVVDNSTRKVLPQGNACGMDVVYFDTHNYSVLQALPKSRYAAAGNYNSAHHSITIDWAIKNLVKTPYVLLVDSDIVFTRDFRSNYDLFVSGGYALAGYKRTQYACPTIAPWCCFINVKKMVELGLSYFDFNRILYVNDNLTHDTGASLYEDFKKHNLPVLETPDNLFWLHFKGGSVFKDKGIAWLVRNSQYWR